MVARAERRSYWTWGYQSDEPSDADRQQAAKRLSERFGREVVVPNVVIAPMSCCSAWACHSLPVGCLIR